jgi:threonine aldolase
LTDKSGQTNDKPRVCMDLGLFSFPQQGSGLTTVDKTIDLRSDTVTRPSPAMRAAMAGAEVGDDVFGDDPTVNRLQTRFAEMAGKEEALFVTSGTQANQTALKCHTQPGDEIICDANSHIVRYEGGGPAALSGVSIAVLPGERGIFSVDMVAAAIRPDDVHEPVTSLVALENTHNKGGGTVWPISTLAEVCRYAHERGLKTHLDGARIFNAVAATGIALAEWAGHFDSVAVCFSKGLGAPVGSILAGSREFIRRARRVRKMLGGGLRQVGILAAAAEYALDHNVKRLAEDHENARLLASELSRVGAFEVETVPTNMVFWSLRGTPEQADALVEACRRRGVWFLNFSGVRFRAVAHLDVTREQILTAAQIIAEEAQQNW